MDDSVLIEQFAKGSTHAAKLLVLRYQRMVFSFLGKFLFSGQVLEDLAQETFLRAFRNISSYDPGKGASFSTWLVTIARNLAINEKMKKKRRREHSGSLKVLYDGVNDGNPQDRMEKNQRNTHLKNALDQLPVKFYSAVVLSYFDELKLEEIAEIENCAVGTVKSRVFRGKRMLRLILEKERVL